MIGYTNPILQKQQDARDELDVRGPEQVIRHETPIDLNVLHVYRLSDGDCGPAA